MIDVAITENELCKQIDLMRFVMDNETILHFHCKSARRLGRRLVEQLMMIDCCLNKPKTPKLKLVDNE